jgi:DNA-binding NtrC family response regulator
MATILILDDEPGIRKLLRLTLEREGHTVIEAANGLEGVALFGERRPDLVISDVAMPGLDGISAMRQIKAIDPTAPVVMMTGEGNTEIAIRAMALGASEYMVKPFEQTAALKIVRAILASQGENEPKVRENSGDAESSSLVGTSDAMYEVFKLIGRVASHTSTVLILGESGTGKELIARAIHAHSPRRGGPFVVLNCAAIPESLFESELFGYEKGAFTGADRQRPGKFELARDGTLFLDEIGDMTAATQAKLLRVLQDQEFYRVGGNETVRTNARIVAATNQNLRADAASGRFRSDLFYRLSVAVVHLPPLRERRGDIPLLANYFLRRAARELKRPVRGIAQDALDLLARYDWPGNVRELSHVVQQAVLLAPGSTLMAEQFLGLVHISPDSAPKSEGLFDRRVIDERIRKSIAEGEQNILPPLMAELERAAIETALAECGGNVSLAAKHLGIHRVTLKSKISGSGEAAE